MFDIKKVDLKNTELKPFVYPPDATAEYTVEDGNAKSKWRFPKEVAEAVASGCELGYFIGYEERDRTFKDESLMAWFSAYALIKSGSVDKLEAVIRKNLSGAGLDAEVALLESRLKEKNNNQEGK